MLQNTSKDIDIKDFLPHRAPFLMVDEWLTIGDTKVTTSFYIPIDCIFVKDGLLQEAGLVENAAQTCSAIVGKSFIDSYENQEDAKPLIGFISSIKKLQVYQLPLAESTLISKAELLSRFDTEEYCICSMSCNIFHNDTCLLTCEVNLIIQEI